MKTVRPWIFVLLVLAVTALVRVRLLNTPLERDEGEYAYVGQLMLAGVPPYRMACNMKLPGTYAAYAAIMSAFGQTIAAIHLGLLLVNAGAIVLIFLLGRRLFSTASGVAAAAAYAVLSMSEGVLGTQAHATHFVVLAALGGILLLLRDSDRANPWVLFASGFLFGTAFLMKQHGLFFGLFAAAYLVALRQWKKLPLLAAGAAAPFALTCLLLWRAGVFARFWFWTFTYASRYVAENSLSEGAAALAETFVPILRQTAALWLIAAVALVLLLRRRKPLFAAALLLFSIAAICPGLYFRPHYVVLLLPAIALLAGAFVRDRPSIAIFAAALLFSIWSQRDFLFHMPPDDVARELYGMDPFPEAIPMAAYIRNHTAPGERIAVLGSEPEIYFYARRPAATSYLYLEPLVEAQPFALAMQNDLIAQVERAAPAYVVRIPIEETLALGAEAPDRITAWWSDYGPKHYRLVGIADILPDGATQYRWEAAAETYQPRSAYHLAVYRRK